MIVFLLEEVYMTDIDVPSFHTDKFNEATRVQMPAMVHLLRLGYSYFGKISEEMSGKAYDGDTNILLDIFRTQFKKLNPKEEGKTEETLRLIRQELDNDDLGRSFYKRLISVSPTRLIDFEHPENNQFHFTAEFTCRRDQDEFRPDITLFINGLPLVFIEVKKPYNQGGMLAESERMNKLRFPNKKFRRFLNITQFMIFSNNMEYSADGGIVPIQGAFYCAVARDNALFNCFREENSGNVNIASFNNNYPYKDIDTTTEKHILSDFNCQVILSTPEYQTNLNNNTPTNRILTSMCSIERLLFLLKYGIAYVKMVREKDGVIESLDQKHIMRYQQLFAALAVRQKMSEGVKSGIIWHTQGSGKTALSYHLSFVLSDYYASQNKVAKFYFIVDRIDLLVQASEEFEARGLEVKTANTRDELMKQFRSNQALQGVSGKPEITVINIQRFKEDKEKVTLPDYATNLQRIFIIDEAHRGYNPTGCFLANLFEADTNSIKIALTGTPLLKEERTSWKVFGSYLHTYYYDKSIQDGYTLKIMREDIETSYKEKLAEVYEKLDQLVKKNEINKEHIKEHNSYIQELLRYIINDLKTFRIRHDDTTLAGMVICESSEQARKINTLFYEIQNEINNDAPIKSKFKAGLILHDEDSKETRKKIITDFKKNGEYDILIVYNMLLTGFDAPRLKRLYFGRKLKDHNLLQALTRVNRPYKDNHYGYVIDFADIKQNFEDTNKEYLIELNRFNDIQETGEGNATDTFQQVLEDKDALIAKMKESHEALFQYTVDNIEEFSAELGSIEDKQELIKLKKILIEARDCYNIVRTFGDEELKQVFAKLEIVKLPKMITEIQHHIDTINQKEAFNDADKSRQLVNLAMQDIKFKFEKISEEELKVISGGIELQEKWSRTITVFTENIDQEDPEYITLREAFMQRFKEHGFVLKNIIEFNEHSKALDDILKKLADLQRINKNLLKKYNGDVKFTVVHKRIKEENIRRKENNQKPIVSEQEVPIFETLLEIKKTIDQKVYDRNDILKKDAYFEQTVKTLVIEGMDKINITAEEEDYQFIQSKISKQYLNQYHATYSAA
jgi:type I restriction enzyme R subunit